MEQQELRQSVDKIGNVRVVKSKYSFQEPTIRYNHDEIVVTIERRDDLSVGLRYATEHIPELNREWTCDGKNRFYDGYTIDADYYCLQVKRGTTYRYVSRIEGRECLLLFPKDACLDYIYVQEAILGKVRDLLHKRAQEVIPEVLQRVSERINVPYGVCKVVRSLRGYCAFNYMGSHNIDFHSSCIQLSVKKLEALCVHELTHNFVRGHGQDFHDKMIELGGMEMYQLDQQLWENSQWHQIKW